MDEHPTIRTLPRFASNATRLRRAFLLGWGLTSTAALAAWIVDSATRPSGTGGLQGLGAALAFLTLLIVIMAIGPVIGLVCAIAAWARLRRRRQAVRVADAAHTGCVDGFFCAYWRRPHAYLDPVVRAGVSNLAQLGAPVDRAVAMLREDLRTGVWHERNREILDVDEIDLGYRLLTTDQPETPVTDSDSDSLSSGTGGAKPM